MSGGAGSAERRLALRVAGHAARVLPASHAAWGRAMLGEVGHLASDRAALRWAVGCLRAAYAARMSGMRPGVPQLSRPVLALEMLTCFTWLAALFASTAEYASAQAPLRATVLPGLLLASLLGPAALAVAAFCLLSGRAAPLTRLVPAALAALAAVTFAGLGTGLLLPLGWRDYVLCVVLPLAGTAHLVLLCWQMPARSGPET